MTEASYQRNLMLGVTGGETLTCQLAALDRVSQSHEISTDTYRAYDCLQGNYERLTESGDLDPVGKWPNQLTPAWNAVNQMWSRELGARSYRAVKWRYAETASQLAGLLDAYFEKQCRIAISIEAGDLFHHSLGLIPAGEDRFLTRGTWSLFEEDEAVAATVLFDQMHHQPEIYEFDGQQFSELHNVMILPPE